MTRARPTVGFVGRSVRRVIDVALRGLGVEPEDAPGALAAVPLLALLLALVSAAVAASGALFAAPQMWPELRDSNELIVVSLLVGALVLLFEISVIHSTRLAMPRQVPDDPTRMPSGLAMVGQRVLGVLPRLLLTSVLVLTVGQMWAVAVNRDGVLEQRRVDAQEAKQARILDRTSTLDRLVVDAEREVRRAERRQKNTARRARFAEARANCEMAVPYRVYPGLTCSGVAFGAATDRALAARERAWAREAAALRAGDRAERRLDMLVARRAEVTARLAQTLRWRDFAKGGWSDTLRQLRSHAEEEDFSVLEEWWPEATVAAIDMAVLLWMLLSTRSAIDANRWRRELAARAALEAEVLTGYRARAFEARREDLRWEVRLGAARDAEEQRTAAGLERLRERLARPIAPRNGLPDEQESDEDRGPVDTTAGSSPPASGAQELSTLIETGREVVLSEIVSGINIAPDGPLAVLEIGEEVSWPHGLRLEIVDVIADPTAPGAAWSNYVLEARLVERSAVVADSGATRFAIKVLGAEPTHPVRLAAWRAELTYARAVPDLQDGLAQSLRGGFLASHPGVFVTAYEYFPSGNLHQAIAEMRAAGEPLSLWQLCGIARRGLVGGRSLAHARFFHNDIRMVNFFVTPDLRAQPLPSTPLHAYDPGSLGDFNSTSLQLQPPEAGGVLASDAEGAPELVTLDLQDEKGPLRADPSAVSDIYAIIAMLYQVTTGYHPGQCDGRATGLVSDPPSLSLLRSDLPYQFTAFVDSAVRVRPARRFDGVFERVEPVATYNAVLRMLDDCVEQMEADGWDLRAIDTLGSVDLDAVALPPVPSWDPGDPHAFGPVDDDLADLPDISDRTDSEPANNVPADLHDPGPTRWNPDVERSSDELMGDLP